MRRILIIIALFLCVIQSKAQNSIDFLGIPVCNADTTTYISALKENGYKLYGKNKDSILYTGSFEGMEASVMLVPYTESAKIKAIVFSLENLNPVKMCSSYAELVQKYMVKYQDMKYDTYIDEDKSIITTFDDTSGFVALKAEVARKGNSCEISIFYSCKNKNTAPSSDGIGMDDI